MDRKRNYTTEIWNMTDVIAIVFYLVGFITRFIVTEALFTTSKIFLCLDLILWYIRVLHLFAAYERLGPKLLMIWNTLKDLFFFVCFIVIFVFGFSIASWSLITTTSQVNWTYADDGELMNATVTDGGNDLWSWKLLRDITAYGVWKIFGQVDRIVDYDAYSNVAFVLDIIFVFISNVLLLNVLVVLFNLTIQPVAKESQGLWRYQRFLIIMEYSEKPPLPPPFNVVYYMCSVVKHVFCLAEQWQTRDRTVATDRTLLTNVEIDIHTIPALQRQFKVTDAMQRESAIADDYWRYTLKDGKKDRIEMTLQNIERDLVVIKDQLQNQNNLSIND